MGSLSQISKPFILDNVMSVKTAAEYSGYSSQYLRRLLRRGKLAGLKLGQVWVVDIDSFDMYLLDVEKSQDHRFGPK